MVLPRSRLGLDNEDGGYAFNMYYLQTLYFRLGSLALPLVLTLELSFLTLAGLLPVLSKGSFNFFIFSAAFRLPSFSAVFASLASEAPAISLSNGLVSLIQSIIREPEALLSRGSCSRSLQIVLSDSLNGQLCKYAYGTLNAYSEPFEGAIESGYL
jgi:hypothetical protein